jgi:predicted aspartyl protease
MCCGYYDGNDRPFIDGVVFLPDNSRLKTKPLLPISFLIDTGADRTLIVPSDYEQRNVKYSDFKNFELSYPGGFGGRFEARLVKCTLILIVDGVEKQATVRAEIACPGPAFEEPPPPPSVLGRDVLDLFRLTIHRSTAHVHLDLP